ncbi:FAD-dependent thymidylate synthase [Candidatus Korobacter versatilis]|nr:FAD-dependent thymidylate synthase [Candidatus Koribacter versatilis]
MSTSSEKAEQTKPEEQAGTQVYAIHGADPEVLAYAMAKYSRSALSMKESLTELNAQKAEKFLNTFYFQYGHRSIADLAHIAMAIESLSLLAATIVVDESRWDGQERSTRYQNFRKSGYFTPDFSGDAGAETLYRDTVNFLFAEYENFSEGMFRYLEGQTPKPDDMKQDAYERTLRARAFDLSRYILPLATNTSLGQIVNARTLETQVSRLLSHTHKEVRDLAQKLKDAAREPSHNVNHAAMRELIAEIREKDADLAARAEEQLLREVRVSPTLVKYAEANAYEIETRKLLQQAASELMKGAAIEPAKEVDLLEPDPLEIELATTLLYQGSQYSYRQLRRAVESLTADERQEIIDLGVQNRGKHDELSRAFNAGQQFRFDILMDVGGYRDMHRHRRCVQVHQPYTAAHGFAMPEEMADAEVDERYQQTMQRAADAYTKIAGSPIAEANEKAQYVLPLAYRKRTLFKMDFAEVVYISEIRTTPQGHYSYRNVAWQMYDEVASKHPSLRSYFRVTDVHEPVDLLKR